MGDMKKVSHEKECTKCRKIKPLNAFWKQKKGLFGHKSICKNCSSDSYQAYCRRNLNKSTIPEFKICSFCKSNKLASEFSPCNNRLSGLRSICKSCSAKKTLLSRSCLRAELGMLKESVPCVDCRSYYPYWTMQFDHLDNKKKTFMISSLRNKKDLHDEMEKCEIVCSNCHANRTYWRLRKMPVQINIGSSFPYTFAKKRMLDCKG